MQPQSTIASSFHRAAPKRAEQSKCPPRWYQSDKHFLLLYIILVNQPKWTGRTKGFLQCLPTSLFKPQLSRRMALSGETWSEWTLAFPTRYLQKITDKRSQRYKTGIPLHFYLHIYLRRNLLCLSRDTAWRYGKDYAAVHLSFYAISKKALDVLLSRSDGVQATWIA